MKDGYLHEICKTQHNQVANDDNAILEDFENASLYVG